MDLTVLKERLEEINDRSGAQVNIEIAGLNDKSKEALGKYDADENKISLYMTAIDHELTDGDYNILPVDLDAFVLLVYCHELGHFIDRKLNPFERTVTNTDDDEVFLKELTRLRIHSVRNEYNAWEQGAAFVPEHLLPAFHDFNYLNMHYRSKNENGRFTALSRRLSVRPAVIENSKTAIVKAELEYLSAMAEHIQSERFKIINEYLGISNWEVIKRWDNYI